MGHGPGLKIYLNLFEIMLALIQKVRYFLNMTTNNTFSVNQIVKGTIAGVFVILGFRMIDGEKYAQLKEVNPMDHTQTGSGELALPLSKIETL
jgi:hypothetical protein